MAVELLQRHLGIVAKPSLSNVRVHHECIPQYTVGHNDRMQAAHSELLDAYQGRLSVAGSSYTGVSVNDCVNAGRVAPRTLGRTGLEQFTQSNWEEVSRKEHPLLG